MSLLQSKALHGAGGFILMGLWAGFANRAYAMPVPMVAGLVQGAITATITLFLKQVIEAIYARNSGWRRLALPPLAAFTISLTLLSLLHSLAGTPALAATISVPLGVSTVYALLYTLTLDRHAI
jgi:hypothetical protein